MKRKLWLIGLILLTVVSTTMASSEIIATIQTNLGDIKVKLFAEQAPVTVENFVALAEGTKEFTDPRDGKKYTRPYYDGIIFHRIIKQFMLQTGDPTGTGRGGPGYSFKDEFQSGLKFDRPGILAMANSGPGTNGSQFFITTVPTSWLNNKHTIFGEVIEGMDVVSKIEQVEARSDRPVKDVVIKTIKIERK